MDAAFNYLKNINNTAETMPEVKQTDGTSLYCLENTMDAAAQQLGFTTKVVVKARYTPKDLTVNTSYFSWKGNYYTLRRASKSIQRNHWRRTENRFAYILEKSRRRGRGCCRHR